MRRQENKWLALPQTIQPPAITPKLETLDALPRSVECLRYFVLSIEFWLSPNGRLRWWIKFNVCLAAWLFIPTTVLLPIVGFALHGLDGLLSTLLSIVVKVVALTALVLVAVLVTKHFPSSSPRSSGRRK